MAVSLIHYLLNIGQSESSFTCDETRAMMRVVTMTTRDDNDDKVDNYDDIRHGPFDILGGLGLMSGPEIFFRTISEQGYFFRRPFGPDYFFHNRKL